MKTLLVIMACGISLGGSLMAIDSASAINDAGNSIHLDQSRQFPETRWANADHYLRVHVPRNSAAMSVLSFQVPGNLRRHSTSFFSGWDHFLNCGSFDCDAARKISGESERTKK